MNWTKSSAIAEIVSSIAILVTLAYLAVQTAQNTDAIETQARQSLFESAQFEQSIWLQNPDLTILIMNSSIEMSVEDKVKLDALMLLALSKREFAFRQYKAGLLDEVTWNQEADLILLLLGSERTRSWWEVIGHHGFDSDFVDAAESIIDNQPLHPYWEGLRNW